MTFKDIRPNHLVFLFDKNKLEVKTCKVKEAQPHVATPHLGIMAPGGSTVDLTLEVDGADTSYVIPDNLSVTFAPGIVLSTDRQGLIPEVEKLRNESQQVIDSLPHHKQVIERTPDILAQLNPQFREQQQTEQRFEKLESMMQQIIDRIAATST